MPHPIETRLQSRIRGHGRGWTFSPRDFADLGGRSTVASGLFRLQKKGAIRPVIRGLYLYPKFSALLNQELAPDLDQVAHALARKFGWRIQPGGAVAANLLALSTQVPARAVYLSDGPNRSYRIGKRTLVFKHSALKDVGFKLRESGLLVQALKHMGQEHITPALIAKLRRAIPAKLHSKIAADTKTATGWVYAAIRRIAKEDVRGKGR